MTNSGESGDASPNATTVTTESHCGKKGCEEKLIRVKVNEIYSIWNRPRKCDECRTTMWAKDEIWTCPINHLFGCYDICIDCEARPKDEEQKENGEEQSKVTIKESIDGKVSNVMKCPKKGCGKALQKAKSKEVYSFLSQLRNCNRCYKMIWSNCDIWTCQNHYIGYDVCTECHDDRAKRVECEKLRTENANGDQAAMEIKV